MEKLQQDAVAGMSRAYIKTKPRGRAIVSSGRGIAARSVAVLSTLLSFAVARGLRADNPARGVGSLPLCGGNGSFSFEEISRIGEALSKLEAAGGDWTAIAAIRLLLLTGCRRGEITMLGGSSYLGEMW